MKIPNYDSELALSRDPSHEEAATILAALRFWQAHREGGGEVPEHFDHFEDTEELTSKQIDELCDTINLEPLAWHAPATIEDFRVMESDLDELCRTLGRLEGFIIDGTVDTSLTFFDTARRLARRIFGAYHERGILQECLDATRVQINSLSRVHELLEIVGTDSKSIPGAANSVSDVVQGLAITAAKLEEILK